MKDNISIIFAAIIGTFLIVILPLYSLLDRQDSMSYNVVLTETTNFVDNIRNNGFIDRQSYLDYIAALSSTANTYKVSIEAYKNTYIHETDENGEIIPDSYIEQKELYNTQDILEVLENEYIEQDIDFESTNIKNNIYLLGENDEVYVRVYNTNITAGSILYNVLAGTTNDKVVNISYGGVVKKVNWELYNKIQAEETILPEVVMSVPVNANNSTNIQKITSDGFEDLDCTLINLDDYIGTSMEELCSDYIEDGKSDSTDNQQYVYLYDLSETANKTIKVAVELRRFETIDIGGERGYTSLAELETSLFDDVNGVKSEAEKHIINEYIRLNGMYADIDLRLRQNREYYVFDIILTDVNMSILDYISTKASITILPGLGEDKNGMASLMAETIEIEIFDENAVDTVTISSPYIWKKLLKTKSLIESGILEDIVYADEEIAFMVSYTGIKGRTSEEIVEAIKENLRIYQSDTDYSDLEFYTEEEFYEAYGIDIATKRAGHIIIKFKYNSANNSRRNYIQLTNNWTTIETESEGSDQEYVMGAQSKQYQVLLDNSGPLEPEIMLEGTKGEAEWYVSDVAVNLIPSTSDTIIRNNTVILGGSGVYKNTLTLTGETVEQEKETTSIDITAEGKTYVVAKAYDYVGNVTTTDKKEIKIDKTAPTAPTITIVKGEEGANGWYKSEVTIQIAPGIEQNGGSGVWKTTYKIEGANKLDEKKGSQYTLSAQGQSKVIATTYDKAGNKSETIVYINIETTVPPKATVEVVAGEKRTSDNEWYVTDVTLRTNVDSGNSVSGFAKAAYKITGASEVPLTEFTEKTKDIKVNGNGIHEVWIYTYTNAGNVEVKKEIIKIDKNAPNEPTIDILKGTAGNNNWYTSNVELVIKSNGDIGTSNVDRITYTVTNAGATTIEKEIADGSKLFFKEEGEYILTVYSRDKALNIVEKTVKINIDKTAPTPAEFVIVKGRPGRDGWYISDVELSYNGAQDNVSGIDTVLLSKNKITQNTEGTKVTLTTRDKAGHTVSREMTIKLDKSVPTDPTININEQPTGTSIFGTLAYNKDINVTITPGVDYFLENKSNQDITTYEVTTKNGKEVIIPETTITQSGFSVTEEGIITITARTYDKAGNVSVSTKTVWIDKTKPTTPKVLSINGETVEGYSTKTITSDSNIIGLNVSGLSEGNDVNVVLVNQTTYEEIKLTKSATSNGVLEVSLSKKGTYSITLNQINMFGTASDYSTGLYYINYK